MTTRQLTKRLQATFGPSARLVKTDGGFLVMAQGKYRTMTAQPLRTIALGLQLASAINKEIDKESPLCQNPWGCVDDRL